MYRIRYYYSSMSKQFFILSVMAFLVVRLALFFVGGFAQYAYVVPTVLLYAVILLLCAFFLMGWRFFYSEFDENTLTYHNALQKKKTALDLDLVTRAEFSKSGISLFCDGENAPRLTIPMWRFGVISPVGVENFQNLMKNRGVPVEQSYRVLPGFGPASRWIGRIYLIFAFVLLAGTLKYGTLVYLILTSN